MLFKRYPEYKESGVDWIGEIPVGWEVTRFKYIAKKPLRYGANESAESDNVEFPRYIRITDIDDEGNLKDDTFKSLEPEKAVPFLLRQGDILFARSGATVGKTFFYDETVGEACFAGYLIKLSVNEKKVNPKFAYYNTMSNGYKSWIQSNTIQATIQNVSADKYQNYVIPFPKLDIQQKIADYLDRETSRINKIIEAKVNLIEKLKEKRTAIIIQAVTKGIDPTVKMKPSGVDSLGDIPENWDVIKTKNMFQVYNGATPTSTNSEYWGGDIVWVTPVDLSEKSKYVESSARTITPEGLSSCGTTIVQKDSLILSTRAPIGHLKISGTELCTNQGCKSLVKKNMDTDIRFYYYYFLVSKDVLNSLGTGTTFLELSNNALKSFLIPVPTKPEEREIADYLDSETEKINKVINKTLISINKLKEYQTSLISNAVTGKIDIRNEV